MALLGEENYGFLGLKTRTICIDSDGIWVMREDRLERDYLCKDPSKESLRTYNLMMSYKYDISRWAGVEGYVDD